MEAGFNGDSPTIIIIHGDTVGVIAKITAVMSSFNYNVERMSVSRNVKLNTALSWIEVSTNVSDELVKEIRKISYVKKVRVLNV